MSAILAQIRKDHLQARKERRAEDAASLSTLIGAMEQTADADKIVSDTKAVEVIKKTLKSIEEMIGYNDLRAVQEKELFEKYLPQQFTEQEIAVLIKEARNNNGLSNMGQIMAHLKTHYAGLYDAKFASDEAKRQLS